MHINLLFNLLILTGLGLLTDLTAAWVAVGGAAEAVTFEAFDQPEGDDILVLHKYQNQKTSIIYILLEITGYLLYYDESLLFYCCHRCAHTYIRKR